jgi:hypothetical protein
MRRAAAVASAPVPAWLFFSSGASLLPRSRAPRITLVHTRTPTRTRGAENAVQTGRTAMGRAGLEPATLGLRVAPGVQTGRGRTRSNRMESAERPLGDLLALGPSLGVSLSPCCHPSGSSHPVSHPSYSPPCASELSAGASSGGTSPSPWRALAALSGLTSLGLGRRRGRLSCAQAPDRRRSAVVSTLT